MFTLRLCRIGLNVTTKNVKFSSFSLNRIISKKQSSTDWTNNHKHGQLLVGLGSGLLALTLLSRFNEAKLNASEGKVDLDEKFGIDLNEIYEECALIFLRNKLLRNALGMPIKITSHAADDVRELHLTRSGSTLYAFIQFDLEGSHNSGKVYSKSRMNPDTKKFATVEIILKLNKPYGNLKELVIMKEEKGKQ